MNLLYYMPDAQFQCCGYSKYISSCKQRMFWKLIKLTLLHVAALTSRCKIQITQSNPVSTPNTIEWN